MITDEMVEAAWQSLSERDDVAPTKRELRYALEAAEAVRVEQDGLPEWMRVDVHIRAAQRDPLWVAKYALSRKRIEEYARTDSGTLDPIAEQEAASDRFFGRDDE